VLIRTQDNEEIIERVAALDVGKAEVMCCVRVPVLTPPKQHKYEKRCYIRDPDGHLIEVGQTTDPQGDWYPAHWPSSTPAEGSE
jgi:hypothetical protein